MLKWSIENYLGKNRIPFRVLQHDPAFSTAATARIAHIAPERVVKTVIVRVDGRVTMVVLHSNEHINMHRLAESLGAHKAEIVPEIELEDHFPDCELGAMPPFGDMYQMPVVVSENVADDQFITFNAGTHTELATIPYVHFKEVVRPLIGSFTSH
jgi:Ala-tRNA(Pro) deacylase